MKKEWIAALVVIAGAIFAWYVGYSTRKSNDNLQAVSFDVFEGAWTDGNGIVFVFDSQGNWDCYEDEEWMDTGYCVLDEEYQMPFAYSHSDIQYGMVYLEDDSLYVGAVGSLKRDDAFVQPSEGNMKAEDDAMQGRTIAAEQYGYLEGSTYINEWLGVSITLPEDGVYRIYSASNPLEPMLFTYSFPTNVTAAFLLEPADGETTESIAAEIRTSKEAYGYVTVLNEEVTLNDNRTYRTVDMIYADKLHEIYYIRPEGDSLFYIRFMNVIEGDADDYAALDLALNGIRECIK